MITRRLREDLESVEQARSVRAASGTVRDDLAEELYAEALSSRFARDLDAISSFGALVVLAVSVSVLFRDDVSKSNLATSVGCLVILAFIVAIKITTANPEGYARRSVRGISLVTGAQFVAYAGMAVVAGVA